MNAMRSWSLAILLVTVLPAPGSARELPPSSGASRLSLLASGSVVPLEAAVERELLDDLTAFFDECHDYADVVGEEPAQDELQRLWAEHEQGSHALLRAVGAPDSPHASLRDREFALLVGFDHEGGAWPVLTRDDGDALTMYTKCPGLEGLRLACTIRGPVPSLQRGVDCERLPELLREAARAPAVRVPEPSP
jgi:hypothetical protein